MSMLVHTHKLTLPWLIRVIVASAGFFQEILVFLSMRTAKEKWLVSFLYGVMRSGLVEIVVYQLYARNYVKWFIEVEDYQIYARNFSFFFFAN